MATNVTTLTTAGVFKIKYGAVDSSGYLIGSTATAPTAGNQTGQALAQLVGIKDFPFALNEPEILNVTGDDGVLSQFQFEPIEFPTAQLNVGYNNMTFAALAMGLASYDVTGSTFLGLQPATTQYQDLVLLTVSQAKTSAGATHYYGYLVLKANAYYQGHSGLTERGEGSFNFNVTANSATAFPWGEAFTAGNQGDTSFVAFEYSHTYEPLLERWTGDGVETTFNMIGDTAEDSTDNLAAYVNGSAATWVTGAPGAGEFGITAGTPDTIVFGTAPPSTNKVVLWHGIV